MFTNRALRQEPILPESKKNSAEKLGIRTQQVYFAAAVTIGASDWNNIQPKLFFPQPRHGSQATVAPRDTESYDPILCNALPFEMDSTHRRLSAPSSDNKITESYRLSRMFEELGWDATNNNDRTRCTTVEQPETQHQLHSSFSSKSTKSDSSSSSISNRVSPKPRQGTFSPVARTA
jgi:hypothetical protein